MEKKLPSKTPQIVTEETPELIDKIWRAIQKKRYDAKVSQEAVLHHLKQLKAQMGRQKAKYGMGNMQYRYGIQACMEMIDKKIEKIKPKTTTNDIRNKRKRDCDRDGQS